MDDLREQLEGVGRVFQQLDERMSQKGRGGIADLFHMRRMMRELLDEIGVGELEALIAEIQRAKEALDRLQQDVVEIRLLKEALAPGAIPLSRREQAAA